jgi:tetratricopeptide (TPR) repeat protein
MRERVRRIGAWIYAHTLAQNPTFWTAFTPALVVAALLFVRNPASNYIFDEQEALLANPYVNGSLKFWQAFQRDFWGLPPDRSIGSYRPIPNLIWRLVWHVSELPWLHHWLNVVGHAANAAIVAGFTWRVSQRPRLGWLAGACFVTSAVLTEAITGVVGLADVLGALGILLSLVALRLKAPAMTLCVGLATFVGLLCKESALVAVPLVTWAALLSAPTLHPLGPRRGLRMALALTATTAALVGYTYLRRWLFPVKLPPELVAPLTHGEPLVQRLLAEFLRWFQQPKLPRDSINNPLADSDMPLRIAGALRVYFRGLVQVLFPWKLSGDYSFAAEPAPSHPVFVESVAGAAALLLPPVGALVVYVRALILEHRARAAGLEPALSAGGWIVAALGLLWVPIAYFPHSNIPILLPTVRAERFWYVPMIGAAWLLALAGMAIARRSPRVAFALAVVFFGFHALRARIHAFDYTDDLTFWRATAHAEPDSAKAHLNYSVMVGARGRLEERLVSSKRALDIAPRWPMAHIYYGDTLCRMRRAEQAWPHYRRGFELAPNDSNLIALALQCLFEMKAIKSHEQELYGLARAHPGSWLAYLATDIVENGERYGGVERKYRPRGYDEGPKQ